MGDALPEVASVVNVDKSVISKLSVVNGHYEICNSGRDGRGEPRVSDTRRETNRNCVDHRYYYVDGATTRGEKGKNEEDPILHILHRLELSISQIC